MSASIRDWSWWFCIECLRDAEIIRIDKRWGYIGCSECGIKKRIEAIDARMYKARTGKQGE